MSSAPVVSTTLPSTGVSTATSGSASAPAGLVQPKDFPLGMLCEVRHFKADPARTTDSYAPPLKKQSWEDQNGQLVVTCHHQLGKGLPVIDSEIKTRPGQSVLESISLRPADGASPTVSFPLGIVVRVDDAAILEGLPEPSDKTQVLVLSVPCGKPDCQSVQHFEFHPDRHKAGLPAFTQTVQAPLLERQDLRLGSKCSFALERQIPSTPNNRVLPLPDPQWSIRKGQRIVTCHFRLARDLPVFDVETVTSPGLGMVESVTIRASDGSFPASVFARLADGTGLSGWSEIEQKDVNFDGIGDLVMPRSHGTNTCTTVHYFVFDSAQRGSGQPPFVDADLGELCNPWLDPQTKSVQGYRDGSKVTMHWKGMEVGVRY